MPLVRFASISLLLFGFLSGCVSAAWPQFRGPDGQGHSNAEGIPLTWSEKEAVAWKTPIPGAGWSSPVISGNQIWMTTAAEEGKSLRAVCVDRRTGKVLHNVEVFRPEDPGPHHKENGYASPTPVIEGERVYVHFGPRGTACLNTNDSKSVWKNRELEFSQVQGAGSTPILHGDLLILTCDGTDQQFVAALNKNTGKVKWKTPRTHILEKSKSHSLGGMAYSTPLIIEVDGVTQVVSTGADSVSAYNVETGEEIWWFQYEGFSLVARPSFGNGLVYIVGSKVLDDHAIYAIRPGRGEIQDKDVVWSTSDGIPHVPSPLLVGQELLVVDDGGVATCFDALTGDVHWKERLGGRYRASPVEIRGRIYVCEQEGKTLVLGTGSKFKTLATNQLDGTFYASPAVAGRALFLRSDTHLYRIEE